MASTDPPPDPVTRLKSAAVAAHAELLDHDWRGWKEQYRLRCAAGHIWSRTASQIIFHQPVACPECKGAQQLARLAAAVEQNGCVCLDTTWRGYEAKYRFRCTVGHLWERNANHLLAKNGATCPQCVQTTTNVKRRRADGLAKLRAAAAARGGECLADRYLGGTARYRFRCREGHEWETVGNDVLRGSWCLRCSHEERSAAYLDTEGLARLHAAAAAKGGVCLSTTYTGQSERYRFRCAQGHEWEANGGRILRGSWCPRCVHDAKMTDIAVLQAIAAERGGECLSTEYFGQNIKLTWRCHHGHVWQAVPGNIKGGNWCKQCAIDARTTDIAVFQAIAAERGGECLSPKYLGYNHKLTFMCHRGHVWQTLPGTIKRGHWCPECANANKIKRADSKARMRYGKAPKTSP